MGITQIMDANSQGTDYNKAVLELSNKEKVND